MSLKNVLYLFAVIAVVILLAEIAGPVIANLMVVAAG